MLQRHQPMLDTLAGDVGGRIGVAALLFDGLMAEAAILERLPRLICAGPKRVDLQAGTQRADRSSADSKLAGLPRHHGIVEVGKDAAADCCR